MRRAPSLLALLAALGACGASSSMPANTSVGSIASYFWQGDVSSVHASWRVPEIMEGSPCGVAATWIGALAEGDGFIQIGTNEECVAPSRDGLPLEASYYTFWSDTSNQFHPRALYQVRAGDLLEATLYFRRRRWRLIIVDDTTGAHASFTTGEETKRQPDRADWAQEDVELPKSYSPYPHLSEVRLSRVLVNGKSPNGQQLGVNVMSVGSGFLAPTRLRDDSFSIRPTD
jgi:hypothetical protein